MSHVSVQWWFPQKQYLLGHWNLNILYRAGEVLPGKSLSILQQIVKNICSSLVSSCRFDLCLWLNAPLLPHCILLQHSLHYNDILLFSLLNVLESKGFHPFPSIINLFMLQPDHSPILIPPPSFPHSFLLRKGAFPLGYTLPWYIKSQQWILSHWGQIRQPSYREGIQRDSSHSNC